MRECMVNGKGEMLEILQEDREPLDDEFKVSSIGYYEVFNEQRYDKAIYDFKIKAWVGVGGQRLIQTQEPTELDKLKANVDYLLLLNGEV